MTVDGAEAAETVDAVFREEWGRLLATLVGCFRDLDLAEEVAADAIATAVERRPADGVPDHPAAWPLTTARRRAVDPRPPHGFRQIPGQPRCANSPAVNSGYTATREGDRSQPPLGGPALVEHRIDHLERHDPGQLAQMSRRERPRGRSRGTGYDRMRRQGAP